MQTAARWRWPFGALVLGALAVTSCNATAPRADLTPRSSDAYPLGPGCNAQPEAHCDNAISRVLVQMLRGSNLAITEESRSELCRRMALDLIGRIPTPAETEACTTETPQAMADRFMATEEYIRYQGRSWGDRFYDMDEQWYNYAYEIDQLVQALYRDRMTYSDFTTRLVVHPGFYARFQGDDWAANVIRYALGRNPRADEVAQLRPLSRVWDSRRFCDGTVWHNSWVAHNVREEADQNCGRTEWAVNYCRCRQDGGRSSCQTDLFGPVVDFGAEGCVDPENADSERNLLRVTDVAAGRIAICPGPPNLPECADRAFAEHDGVAGQLPRLGGINGAMLDRLYGLGRVLATRPDYWEAAVDRELRRFLSWWQNGLRRPDFDVPEVRRVMAEELRRTGSIRQLQRTIVTSLLYIQPAELPAGVAAPPPGAAQPPVWSFGPTRVLTGERWVDSAAMAVLGFVPDVCDYRFVANNYDWYRLVDHRLVMPTAQPNNPFTGVYRGWAVALGGCSATRFHTTQSTLSIATAQHQVARAVCAYGSEVYTPDVSEGESDPAVMARVITRLYHRTLGRDPDADELNTARDEINQCVVTGNVPDDSVGCPDTGSGYRWLCVRLLESAEFGIF